MKRILVFVVLALVFVGGCGTGAGEFASGAAVGGAVTGVWQAMQEREAQLAIRFEQALKEKEVAVTELEKATAQLKLEQIKAEMESVKKVTEPINTVAPAIQTVTTTDWSNPTAAATGAALITNILTALYYRRKEKK